MKTSQLDSQPTPAAELKDLIVAILSDAFLTSEQLSLLADISSDIAKQRQKEPQTFARLKAQLALCKATHQSNLDRIARLEAALISMQRAAGDLSVSPGAASHAALNKAQAEARSALAEESLSQ